MSKEFVRAVLREEAESNVPAHSDLWSNVYKKVEGANRSQARAGRLRMAFNPRPLLLGGALALALIALLSVSLWTQPTPAVSAEEIVARAAQVVAEEPGADLRSFHGVYTFRYRHDPNGRFNEDQQETWFEAPAKYAQKSANSYADGLEQTWAYGIKDGFTYNYITGLDYIQMSDLAFFHMQDPTTTTLKVRPFSHSSLESVLESARRKLPPPRNDKSDPRPPYMYEVKLSGEEQILGRTAYVLEMTLVPGASIQTPNAQVPEKMKMWVDKALFAVLRMEGWGAEGVVLQSGIYRSFEVNGNTKFDVLDTLAPPGTDIVDARPVPDAATVDKAWQAARQHALYTVFSFSSVPEGLEQGRPFYDRRREVISQQYQGKAIIDMQEVHEVVDASGKTNSDSEWSIKGPRMREVTITRLIITQGPSTSIKADGLGPGAPVQIGNLKGLFYSQDGANTLMFDRDGTRIKLYSSPIRGVASYTSDELVKIAEALQPMEKK